MSTCLTNMQFSLKLLSLDETDHITRRNLLLSECLQLIDILEQMKDAFEDVTKKL